MLTFHSHDKAVERDVRQEDSLLRTGSENFEVQHIGISAGLYRGFRGVGFRNKAAYVGTSNFVREKKLNGMLLVDFSRFPAFLPSVLDYFVVLS
jgi:hypothetical protein